MKKFLSLIMIVSILNLPLASAATFSDVDTSEIYQDGIEFLAEQNIINGYPDGSFRPGNKINRAELLKIIVEAQTSSDLSAYSDDTCFEDVPQNEWFTKHVCYAKEKGWVVGFENGRIFLPAQNITFVEALKIALEGFNIDFPETPDIWYRGLVNTASSFNYIPFTMTSFQEEIKRNEVADMITRILKDQTGSLNAYLDDRYDVVVTYESLLSNENLAMQEIVQNVELSTDYEGAKVEEGELIQGCFGKDCIPSINNPIFESTEDADTWLEDDDRVFAIDYEGVQRAYPQRIMNWHEIVNDTINGDPIAITFCPLCGSALAFERIVDGVITELGVSGFLHNNDLVMYDRYEGSLWQQITGEAIVGPAAQRNETLTQVPITTTTWGEWKAEFPETVVLSRETGYSRNYNLYPYGTYEEDDTLLFGIPGLDTSLQIKTVVYGVEINNASKAYPEDVFSTEPTINDTVGGVDIKLQKLDSGQIIVTNLNTNEEIIPIRLFWFAWAAFHPGTELYTNN